MGVAFFLFFQTGTAMLFCLDLDVMTRFCFSFVPWAVHGVKLRQSPVALSLILRKGSAMPGHGRARAKPDNWVQLTQNRVFIKGLNPTLTRGDPRRSTSCPALFTVEGPAPVGWWFHIALFPSCWVDLAVSNGHCAYADLQIAAWHCAICPLMASLVLLKIRPCA